MPAKNVFHDAMIAALQTDGWTITDDPLTLHVGERDLHVDLGAERPFIGATKGTDRIAVEVQSFLNPSAVADLQQAIGQYAMYRVVLAQQQPDRPVYLAVPQVVYDGILDEPLGQLMLTELGLRVIVFDPNRREIVRWIN